MMKYLKFDYEGILADYKSNKTTLKSNKKLIAYYEKGEGVNESDLNYYEIVSNPNTLAELHRQADELQLYVDLVDNSLSALQENEHLALEFYYIDGKKSEECAERMRISVREFFRIKAVAFDKFCKVIYWQ